MITKEKPREQVEISLEIIPTLGTTETDRWYSVAMSDRDLIYEEPIISGIPRHSVVLGDPVHQHAKISRGIRTVYENVPQSLREVEETITFKV